MIKTSLQEALELIKVMWLHVVLTARIKLKMTKVTTSMGILITM